MSVHSVLALQAATKTQTRRLDKPGARRYHVGETIYVKESWHYYGDREYLYQREPACVLYAATNIMSDRKWWTPLFMPEWASRFRLEVTDVREQRLQEITDDDAWAEGLETWGESVDAANVCRAAKLGLCSFEEARASYLAAWAEMHGWKSLRANQKVVAYTFREVPR